MESQRTSQILQATQNGNYPEGTTAQELAGTPTKDGWTALHLAAQTGCLPPHTTAQDLAAARDRSGWSALHDAAECRKLPANTARSLLCKTKCNRGISALRIAILNNADITQYLTALDLINDKSQNGMDTLTLVCREHIPKYKPESSWQYGMIMKTLTNTNTANSEEIRCIGAAYAHYFPVETALWIKKQITGKKSLPPIGRHTALK